MEEKKAVALKDGHMDDCFTFFMALEEESKSARVIRKCSSVLNRFLKYFDLIYTLLAIANINIKILATK